MLPFALALLPPHPVPTLPTQHMHADHPQAKQVQGSNNIIETPKKEKTRTPASDDDLVALQNVLNAADKARHQYKKFSQEQVDAVFKAASIAANQARIPLAKMAAEETRMGIAEDKVGAMSPRFGPRSSAT